MYTASHIPQYQALTMYGDSICGTFGDLLDCPNIHVLFDEEEDYVFIGGAAPCFPPHTCMSMMVCVLSLLMQHGGCIYSHQIPFSEYTRIKSAFFYRVVRPLQVALAHVNISANPLVVKGNSSRFSILFVDVGVVCAQLRSYSYID